MTSLRPSLFYQTPRQDGGPFLIIDSSYDESGGVDVTFSDVAPDQIASDTPTALLLRVNPERLEIWPLNVRRDRGDYLQPRYGALERIVVARPVDAPYVVPETVQDVLALLEQLPDGFAKDFRFGLGLLWEYRHICEMIAAIPGVTTLLVHGEGGENDARIDGPMFILGIKRFHRLRRELNRIAARHQRSGRRDKDFHAYHELLHAADPGQFPEKKKRIRPDTIADMTGAGRDRAALSSRDRRAVVRMVHDNVQELAKSEPYALMALKSDIELVTLKQLIDRYRDMLEKSATESDWQRFFLGNPFVLSLAFSIPFMLVQGQAYAGGKRLDGTGGKYPDFLLASASTGNLALIEIKRPKTELLGRSPYRGDDVFGPSSELGGAVAQVLNQRLELQRELPLLKERENRNDIHGFSVRCIVIAGTTPAEHQKKKSFELYRNSMTDIAVVTFDELLARLIEIQGVLRPPALDGSVPF